MQPLVKKQFDAIINNCDDDEERKQLLLNTGEDAISTGYMKIVETMASSATDQQKLARIENLIFNTTDIIEYVTDQQIFYGYSDVSSYDNI